MFFFNTSIHHNQVEIYYLLSFLLVVNTYHYSSSAIDSMPLNTIYMHNVLFHTMHLLLTFDTANIHVIPLVFLKDVLFYNMFNCK